MNKRKSLSLLTVLPAVTIAPISMVATGCGNKKDETVHVSSVSFSKDTTYSIPGHTGASIDVKVLPENAQNKEVSYVVADPTIATVLEGNDGTIKIKGLKRGDTTITATTTDGNKTATMNISIVQPAAPESVSVSPEAKAIAVGESFKATATVAPETALQYVNWEIQTGSESIVSVTPVEGDYASCVITGLAQGRAIINVSTLDGEISTIYTVDVGQESGVELSQSSITISKTVDPKEYTISATVLPETTEFPYVSWSVTEGSDFIDITPNQNSVKITAKAAGEAKVTATTTHGKQATCSVLVEEGNINVKTISFDEEFIYAKPDETLLQQPTYTLLPVTATDKSVIWSSSDENVAVITSLGYVKAIREGSAKIIVTSKSNPEVSAYINLIVTKDVKPVKSITLSPNNTWMLKDQTLTLQAILEPKEASRMDLIWSSSDENIATVDEKGVVTSKNLGNVEITAKYKYDEKISATAKIAVLEETPVPSSATIVDENGNEVTAFEDEVGFEKELTCIVKSGETTISEQVQWISYSTDVAIAVATSPNKAIISGLKEGTARIRVQCAKRPEIYKDVTVTVKPKSTILVERIVMAQYQTINLGTFLKLDYTVLPTNASNKDIEWSSADTEIAEVTVNGVIKPKKEGVVGIIAKAKDGSGVQTICQVTINYPDTFEPLLGSTRSKEYLTKHDLNKLQWVETNEGWNGGYNRWKKPEFKDNKIIFDSNGRNNDTRFITESFALNIITPAHWTKEETYNYKISTDFHCSTKSSWLGGDFYDTIQFFELDSFNDHPTWYNDYGNDQQVDSKSKKNSYHDDVSSWRVDYTVDYDFSIKLGWNETDYPRLNTYYFAVSIFERGRDWTAFDTSMHIETSLKKI